MTHQLHMLLEWLHTQNRTRGLIILNLPIARGGQSSVTAIRGMNPKVLFLRLGYVAALHQQAQMANRQKGGQNWSSYFLQNEELFDFCTIQSMPAVYSIR